MLRDYQQDLYNKVRQSYAKGNKRVLVCSPCGSGKSYLFSEMAKNTSGEVLILTHRRELLNQHSSLLFNLGVCARISMVLTEANRLGQYPTPRLIIADEAHLSMSNSWQKIIDYYNTYTCGFTATPVRLDGKPLGDVYQDLITGITVKELISQHRLAPYEYYAPITVETDSLRVQRGDYVVTDLEALMMNKAIYGDVIATYKKLADKEMSICYCVSVKHAEQVAELFREAGYSAVAISSHTPEKEREQIMQDFRDGKITILCNVGIISEGVSINEVSVCILLRPTESLALHIQQSQRCMRYAEGKTAKILDFVGNYTRHGLPDDEHEWSLTAGVHKNPRINKEGNFTIRTCPKCYSVFETADLCPYCGAQYPLHPREIKAKQDIEIARITKEEMAAVEAQKKVLRQEVGRARSKEDLMRIAKERGYKPGWVWQQMKVKGIYR